MVRASLVLVLLATSLAGAAPHGWSLPLGPGWKDITAEAEKDPGIEKMAKQFRDMGGVFEATAYENDAGLGLFIALLEVPDMSATMAEIDAFEHAARDRAAQAGTEELYREERLALTLGSTAHVRTPTIMINTRRIAGFLQGGGLRGISINCYGEAADCDPLLASAALDTSTFRTLASLDKDPKQGRLRLLFAIACSIAALLIVAAVKLMKRQRQRGSGGPA